jgi:CHAT domain-containing protein
MEPVVRRVYDLLTAYSQTTKGETPKQQMARLARTEADLREATAALSRMILNPAALLLGNKRLLIVADGILQYIPFAVLPAPAAKAQPLIISHEIINLPSASALAVLRNELSGRKPAAKAVVVFADPVFDRDDPRVKSAIKGQTVQVKEQAPYRNFQRALREFQITDDRGTISRLPFTREEADAILAAIPGAGGMKAVDFKASRVTATSTDLREYRIIHFATHGLLNSEHPELSGLVLSLVDEQGLPQNGFLRLQDIYNLDLPVELVVLSACNTALGKEIKGEGLVGLTRGFMYAGAKSVMASLWKVDDVATAELMKRLYKKMLKEGMKPAAALRAAQVEMWNQKQWKSPYYWGAFILQGEWR